MSKPEQLAGGTLLRAESRGKVSPKAAQSGAGAANFIAGLSCALRGLLLAVEAPRQRPGCRDSITANCATLPARGQQIGERGGSLARRRYQKGRVFLRGIKNPVWVGRWREDVIEDGRIRRPERSEVLGSKSDIPTKRLALRELEKRLTVVNDPRYRARPDV